MLPRIFLNSVSESSCAVVSRTSRIRCSAATSASNSSATSPISAARPFSARSFTKLMTDSSAPSAICREDVLLHPRVDLGVLEHEPQVVERRRGPAEVVELLLHGLELPPLLRRLEQGARVDAVSDGYARLPSSAEKSISASASSISRCWSSPVSDLRVIFSAARSDSFPTSSRIWPSACAVAWSIWRRVSSSRRWRSSSVSCADPVALRVREAACFAEDLLRLATSPGRSACGAPRAGGAPRRVRCPPRRLPARCARAACRSSAGSGRTRTS